MPKIEDGCYHENDIITPRKLFSQEHKWKSLSVSARDKNRWLSDWKVQISFLKPPSFTSV